MTDPLKLYASVHQNPQGENDARPTALQIIKDENLFDKWAGKVILITGCTSGIGVETARALHATGADVFMQVRDFSRGKVVLDEIRGKSGGKGKLELVVMELGSLESVREGAKEFLERGNGVCNVLVCNAGVRNPPEGKTVDGFETQFGVNHLSHFLLFQLLLPALKASSTPAFNSRVLTVSSGSHRSSPIHLDNLNLTGIYTPRLGYAQSKTANILMANQITYLYTSQGIQGLSISPGAIVSGAQRYDDPKYIEGMILKLSHILKSTEQGAATQVWGAVAPVLEGKGGLYLENVAVAEKAVEGEGVENGGYADFAFDRVVAEKLWEVSLELVGLGGK